MKKIFTTILIITGAALATAIGYAFTRFQVSLPGLFESGIGYGTIAGILGMLIWDLSQNRPYRQTRPATKQQTANYRRAAATGQQTAKCAA